MTAEIHQLKQKKIATNWMCSACGVDAGCNCGAPLMSKGQRASAAIAANPEKSDRAIAADLGIHHSTVQDARKLAGDPPVDERVGIDGKRRRMPIREADDDNDTAIEVSPKEKREGLLFGLMVRADEATKFAFYDADFITDEAVGFVRKAAIAWSDLLAKLEKLK